MDLDPNPHAPPSSRPGRAAGPVPRRDYPWWVKVSLWGVPGRPGLWAFVALSLAAVAGCVIYGFWGRRFFWGSAFLISALMYWQSIRWIDHHGSWGADG